MGLFYTQGENMSKVIVPTGYTPKLGYIETNVAIKYIKDHFQRDLARYLKLTRVSAPLFVDVKTGLNDTLNGIEAPVAFKPAFVDVDAQVVHSLAKWKRYALGKYEIQTKRGIYTDMNAIRKDEELDNIHSLYVDQWDWEAVISKEDRNVETLKSYVDAIYSTLKDVKDEIELRYPQIEHLPLPEKLTYITSQELLDKYPDLSPRAREDAATREYGAIFLMQIGGELSDGTIHDGRAPDYDDWSLNGDIIVWNKMLDRAFELSSMGIRVSEESLKEQLAIRGKSEMETLPFHKAILDCELPYSIGGGIGQSRLCMFMLQKAHIGEVQSSIWDSETERICGEHKIPLL